MLVRIDPLGTAQTTEVHMNRRRSTSQSNAGLLSLRAALLITLALISGGVAGILTYLAARPIAGAVLAGLMVTGGAVITFDKLIERQCSSHDKGRGPAGSFCAVLLRKERGRFSHQWRMCHSGAIGA